MNPFLLMNRVPRFVAALLMSFGLCSPAHAGQWVVDHYEWGGNSHSESLLRGVAESTVANAKYASSIYEENIVGRNGTEQPSPKFDSPNTIIGAPVSASVAWNAGSAPRPADRTEEGDSPATLSGNVSGSVTAVLKWQRDPLYDYFTGDYVYDSVTGEPVGDPKDSPQTLYVREVASASGYKQLHGNGGNAINEMYTADDPWRGEYFEISGSMGSYDNGTVQTNLSYGTVGYGGFNKTKIYRIDNPGDEVKVPTYSFSGSVKLNAGYEKEHLDWGGSATISFGYGVDVLDFNLNVSGPIVSRKLNSSGTQEIEALAGLRWMDPPVRQADGTWDKVRAPFDSLADSLGLQFGGQDGLLPPLPYFEGTAGFEVAGSPVYNPQTYKWSPENSTEPKIGVGSDRQRSYTWNFGPATPGGSGLSKDTDVSVEALPGEGAVKNDGDTIEAKAKIHWSSIFSPTDTGIQKNTISPPSFMFRDANGGIIFTISLKKGNVIKTFVKGGSGFAGDTGKNISIRPVPGDQDQTPGPDEHVEFREVTSVTPMGDGSIIVSFKTDPQVDPDNDPNAPGYEEMKLAGEVADLIEQTNQTGQILVGTALTLEMEAVRAVSIGRLENWGLESAIKGLVSLGKLAEASKAASAGIATLERDAEKAQAALNELRNLQRKGGLSAGMAAKVERNIASLERSLAQKEGLINSSRTTAQKLEEYVARTRAEIQKNGCFVAGTRVWMSDGTTKVIEQVKVGDLVLSKNEATGETVAKRVTHTSIRPNIWTLKLHFENGQVLETTDEHPLYVEGRGFLKAKEAGVGTSIVTRAGPAQKVVQVERDVRAATVYNFTVEDFHTYFVGDSALWVHNADCVNTYDEFYGNFGIYGTLDRDGIVEFAIEAGSQSPVRGTQMFENMLAKFGDNINAVRGSWTYGDNLAEINRLTAGGMELEDAAKLTWTGKRCGDNGFVNMVREDVQGSAGNYTKVLVKFFK